MTPEQEKLLLEKLNRLFALIEEGLKTSAFPTTSKLHAPMRRHTKPIVTKRISQEQLELMAKDTQTHQAFTEKIEEMLKVVRKMQKSLTR